MKENNNYKQVRLSTKKKIKQIEKSLDIYAGKNINALEEHSVLVDVKSYCEVKKLDYADVCSIIDSIDVGIESGTLMYNDVLDWIDARILNREFDKNFYVEQVKNDKFDLELINDKMSLKKIVHHQDEKNYLIRIRIALAQHKSLYNRLVKKGYLVDYRKPENWHSKKREAYYKKLDAQKRGADE